MLFDMLNIFTDNMWSCLVLWIIGDRRGRDRIVVGFITTYAINSYHH